MASAGSYRASIRLKQDRALRLSSTRKTVSSEGLYDCVFYHECGIQTPSRGCVTRISCEKVTGRTAYTYCIYRQGASRRTDSRLRWFIRRDEANRNAGPSVEITRLVSRARTFWGSSSSPGTSSAHVLASGLDIILPSSSSWLMLVRHIPDSLMTCCICSLSLLQYNQRRVPVFRGNLYTFQRVSFEIDSPSLERMDLPVPVVPNFALWWDRCASMSS